MMFRQRSRCAWLMMALLAGCGAYKPTPPGATRASGPQSLQVISHRMDGHPLLAADAARATQAGAGPLQIIGADMASEGDRIGSFVEIPQGECVLAFARSSPTIGDVDLFAYEDDGSAFSSDEAAEARATILVCPPHPRRLYVVARIVSGAGAIGVGVQPVPISAADAVATAVGARGRPGDESGRLESWPGLETKLRDHRQALGSRWEDVRRTALPVGARAATRVGVGIGARRCLDAFISPSDEVNSLEVVAEDATGRILARAKERGQDRSLVLCSEQAVDVSVAIRSRSSQGLVALVVGQSQVGAEPEIQGATSVVRVTETRQLSAAQTAHHQQLAGRGLGAAKTVIAQAKLGSRTTVPIELPAGCARVDIIAGKPLADVVSELWNDRHELISQARSGATGTIFSCGSGGKMRLDVEALGQPGPFAVEVRKDAVSPAVLVNHPIAAARMLVRLSADGLDTGASAAAAAQVVPLDQARMSLVTLPIAANACVQVIAALDNQGAGLDLRLVDKSTGASSLVRARHVVADRLCAANVPLQASIELRLQSGQGNALLLTRPVAAQ